MKKISSEKIINGLRSIVFRFPITIIFVLITSFRQVFIDEFFDFGDPLYLILYMGTLFSIVTQILYERFYADKFKIRIGFYSVFLVLLFLYRMYIFNSHLAVDYAWNAYSIPGIRSMILYFIGTMAMIWIPSIKSKVKFSDSFLVFFKAYFTTGFFSIILFLGIMATLFLFESLFFGLDPEWYSNTSILIFYLFAPLLFLTFIPRYNTEKSSDESALEDGERTMEEATKVPKFLYYLITYILIPIMAILTVIIVAYILTNLRTGFFRENLLENLLLNYTINGWILLTLGATVDYQIVQWFRKVFPFALIFVIALQMMSTYLQIKEIGVTHGRYFILLFGVGSIISAIWYLAKNQDLRILPIVAIIAGVIALIPPIDAMSVSVRQQKNRIEAILEENDMFRDEGHREIEKNPDVSEDEQEKVKDSLEYLSGISALNKLEWLPQDEYEEPVQYLGFEDDASFWPSPDDWTTEEDPTEIDISVDMDYLNVPVAGYDQLLEFYADSDSTNITEEFEVDSETYNVTVLLEEGFVINLETEDTDSPIEFDFSYVLDEFEGEENYSLSPRELTFTEEEEDYEIQILIQNIYQSGDHLQIDFYLFI